MNKFGWKPLAVATLPLFALSLSAQQPGGAAQPARLVGAAQAPQEKSQEDFIKLRDEKMSHEVFKQNAWTFDFDKARAEAKKSGKLIFAYFTRSYAAWGPCTAVENNVFSKAEFGEFAKQVILFAHNTTHVKTDAYQSLLSEMGFGGFPTLAFLNANGDLLDVPKRTIPELEAGLAKAQELEKTVMAKAAAGDAPAKKQVFLTNLERGSIKLADAKKGLETVPGLTKEERAKVEAKLPTLEMNAINATAWEDRPAAGKKLAVMFKAGRIPTGADGTRFLNGVIGAAEADKDVKLFEEAFAKLKPQMQDNPRAQQQLEGLEKRLEKLKESAKQADGKSGETPAEPRK